MQGNRKNPQEKTYDEEFDWIKIKAEIDESHVARDSARRFKHILLSNPFVPLGCLATVIALGVGLKNFHQGNHRMQQICMRARVGAQGFTVFALLGGVFYEAFK